MHASDRGGIHVTDRIVGFAICLLALSVLAVPSKAQALPVLLSVQSTQVTFGQDLNDNALVLHSGVFRGNWLGLIPWGGGGWFIFARLILWRRRWRRRLSGLAGGFPGSAGGFPGSAGGFPGSASGFLGSASAFLGSAGSFPGGGVGPYVTFTIVTLLWDGHLDNGIGQNSAQRNNSTWTGPTASTASLASDGFDEGSGTSVRVALRGRSACAFTVGNPTATSLRTEFIHVFAYPGLRHIVARDSAIRPPANSLRRSCR